MRKDSLTPARCRCGKVAFELTGRPILTATCHCDSCRRAAAVLEALPGAPPVRSAEGSADFVLARKDRARPVTGADRLREHRLGPKASTRRVVAECCASPMFLEFENGHWLSVYRDRIAPEDRPPIQMRTMTKDLGSAAADLDPSIPSVGMMAPAFMGRLLGAWIAMGFKVPPTDYVKGTLDAR